MDWPFVGRTDELELVTGLASGGRPGVVIAGRRGVGATRLARECAAVAPVPSRIVDDAHLLSHPVATRLREEIRDGSAFTIVTCAARARAADPVRRLWRDDGLHRIDLQPLPEAAVVDLLSTVLGARVERAAVATLIERSAGTVLFLRELVLSARTAGVLARDADGPWRLTGPVPLSDRIVEIVQSMIADGLLGELDEPARDFLEVVAYAQPVGRTELTVAGDPAVGERLERAGLLVSARNGRRLEIRLCHPLYADVLRDGIPALRAT